MASRPFLSDHLSQSGKAADELRELILHIAQAGVRIQAALRKTDTGLSGTQNQFGEEQVKLDIVSDDIIQKHLKESGLVASYISEEQKDVIELSSTAPYSVVYDPLDGSSLVDVNFAVGSIFGIYRGNELIGKKPKQQVAALYVLYGPRTLLVYCTGNGVHEFILNDTGEFVLLREFLKVTDTAKNFAPGNLGSIMDDKPYHDVFHAWLKDKMTLRYSGCMVADIHHILSKGQGVFTYPAGSKYPEGKLRLVFECGPFAYLMEHAGGAASDGTGDIMNTTITDIDQRTPIIIGSKTEVRRACRLLTEK